MLSLAALDELEEAIATTVEAYVSLPPDDRARWVREQLGAGYPADLRPEALRDLISRAVNDSGFRSMFECPDCGRIALSDPARTGAWLFYEPSK